MYDIAFFIESPIEHYFMSIDLMDDEGFFQGSIAGDVKLNALWEATHILYSITFVFRICRFYSGFIFPFSFHSWYSCACHVYIAFIERAFIFHVTLFLLLFSSFIACLMCIHVVSYKHGGVPLGQCHSSMGEGVVCTP